MSNQTRPNLFVIGAMKSGTSTLHALLAEHPEIFMSEPKEPCYFVDPAQLERLWPEMWRMGFWKSEQAYLGLFDSAAGARYIGESSTDYAKLPLIEGVPERIAALCPEARFIYIMRDPVERTISHYWHMVEHRQERRPPLEAIKGDRHYIDVSNYAYQLRPYIERFGVDRIYVTTFEEFTREPRLVMRSIFHWLGVEADFTSQLVSEAKNVTPARVTQKRGFRSLDRFRHSKLWEGLSPFFPAAVRRLGVNLVEKKINRADTDMTAIVDYLRPMQQSQTDELSHLLHRDFPEWKTLYEK